MKTQCFYVITDATGNIIAASSEIQPGTRKVFISPAKGHSLHRVADVPADIAANMNPDEFHKQMMNHFKNHSKKTTLVDPSEHRTYWLRHGLAVPKK